MASVRIVLMASWSRLCRCAAPCGARVAYSVELLQFIDASRRFMVTAWARRSTPGVNPRKGPRVPRRERRDGRASGNLRLRTSKWQRQPCPVSFFHLPRPAFLVDGNVGEIPLRDQNPARLVAP